LIYQLYATRYELVALNIIGWESFKKELFYMGIHLVNGTIRHYFLTEFVNST